MRVRRRKSRGRWGGGEREEFEEVEEVEGVLPHSFPAVVGIPLVVGGWPVEQVALQGA